MNRIYWSNLASLRFWFGTAFGALIVGFVVSLLWKPGGYIAFFVVLPLLMFGALTESPLYCPHCKKRVKVCHHCGRNTTQS